MIFNFFCCYANLILGALILPSKELAPRLFYPFLDASSHLYPSVRPSVRRYVRPLRKCKNRVSRLFLATMRSYTESNDRQTCFESLLYYSSVSPYMSHVQYTQRHSPDASLPGRACYYKHTVLYILQLLEPGGGGIGRASGGGGK